ncbi:hypothetical protein [Nocardia sp. NPDC020380]|uniref:hypothetical protein n=1 Tax=Nocardia sp. NPDC020380 TaxID=3364309 RepID=UPI0037A875A6
MNNLPRNEPDRKSIAVREAEGIRGVRRHRSRSSIVHWGAEIGVAVIGALLASGIITAVEHTSVAVYDHSMTIYWK